VAYPTIVYDATSGSDTAPSDLVGSGTNADLSGATITLNATVDLSGALDDGSDYIYFVGSSGDRHLHQITAFNPNSAACTSITIAESGTTRTASNWYVNGTRQTLENDATYWDFRDLSHGWTLEFKEGTYNVGDYGTGSWCSQGSIAGTSLLPPLTIRAHSAATSKPVINFNNGAYGLIGGGAANCKLRLQSLRFTSSAGTAGIFYPSEFNSVVSVDCSFNTEGGWVTYKWSNTNYFINCFFGNGSDSGYLYRSSQNTRSVFVNCLFDASQATSYALQFTDSSFGTLIGCAILDGAGDGIRQIGTDSQNGLAIIGCTIAGCAGDGVVLSSNGGETWIGMIANCVIAYNGGYGITAPPSGVDVTHWGVKGNAIYGNTSGNYNGDFVADASAITLSADPFTNRAGGDYSLNNTAGGGALLRGAAYPASMPDGS
jgi:hypothetical protein